MKADSLRNHTQFLSSAEYRGADVRRRVITQHGQVVTVQSWGHRGNRHSFQQGAKGGSCEGRLQRRVPPGDFAARDTRLVLRLQFLQQALRSSGTAAQGAGGVPRGQACLGPEGLIGGEGPSGPWAVGTRPALRVRPHVSGLVRPRASPPVPTRPGFSTSKWGW